MKCSFITQELHTNVGRIPTVHPHLAWQRFACVLSHDACAQTDAVCGPGNWWWEGAAGLQPIPRLSAGKWPWSTGLRSRAQLPLNTPCLVLLNAGAAWAFARTCWTEGRGEKKQELLSGITSSQNWEKKRKLNKRDCRDCFKQRLLNFLASQWAVPMLQSVEAWLDSVQQFQLLIFCH